jgi:hypothetical protein
MLTHSSYKACFEHLVFLTVKEADPTTNPVKGRRQYPPGKSSPTSQTLREGTGRRQKTTNSTTSLLTATTLIYAIGAGITAAAGTRLALQLFLVKGFRLYSFQLPELKRSSIVISCHYLPVSGLGNLRACCLPWKW